MLAVQSESPFRLPLNDVSDIGLCRRSTRQVALAAGLDDTEVGRAEIIAVELATNLIRHAGEGELVGQILRAGAAVQVELMAIDRGPGMPNVRRCLVDGYSTSGTAGNGLGAVLRLSDTFDVYSAVRHGTVVLARIGRGTQTVAGFADGLQFGALCLAMRGEAVCGDSWACLVEGADLTLLVVDGVGHGPPASSAANAAAAAFCAHTPGAPSLLLHRLHQVLAGTRGAAAACCRFDPRHGTVSYCGVGNIGGQLWSADAVRGLPSHNGMLGMRQPRIQDFHYLWPADSLLVMHSDGLTARHALDAYDALFQRHPAVIAAVLYRDYARARDDATVLVVRRPA